MAALEQLVRECRGASTRQILTELLGMTLFPPALWDPNYLRAAAVVLQTRRLSRRQRREIRIPWLRFLERFPDLTDCPPFQEPRQPLTQRFLDGLQRLSKQELLLEYRAEIVFHAEADLNFFRLDAIEEALERLEPIRSAGGAARQRNAWQALLARCPALGQRKTPERWSGPPKEPRPGRG